VGDWFRFWARQVRPAVGVGWGSTAALYPVYLAYRDDLRREILGSAEDSAVIVGDGLSLGAGTAVAAAAGLAVTGLGLAWPQWLTARGWLALRGDLPLRLLPFLEDAHRRQVLRQAGPFYQFSHIELQHHLAGRFRPRKPVPSG
jgi:hypothetical protein